MPSAEVSRHRARCAPSGALSGRLQIAAMFGFNLLVRHRRAAEPATARHQCGNTEIRHRDQRRLADTDGFAVHPTKESQLILDAPTEGIQPKIVHEISDVIQRLNREANLTVLLVEQKLPFARRVASDLRILDNGRLVVSGKIGALTDELVRTHLTA